MNNIHAAAGQRPQLVLDIGGVLATNLSPKFWEWTAEAAGLDYKTLYGEYKRNMSSRLWRGEIEEAEFWEWLLDQGKAIPHEEARLILSRSLLPLPSMQLLPVWSQSADIHILSNHLHGWVAPLLAPVRTYLSHVIVSSEIGMKKPQRELFAHAASLLPEGAPVLFVDDQIRNLSQAEAFGWNVVLADEEGAWTKAAQDWLAMNSL